MKVNYRIISTTGRVLIDTTVDIESSQLQELKSELEEMVDDVVGADRYEVDDAITAEDQIAGREKKGERHEIQDYKD